MIGNKHLQAFYEYADEDTGLNQLLESLMYKDIEFINSLNQPVDLDKCDEDEIKYLTMISALIDYFLQIHELEVPDWLRDDRLQFIRPYYHSKRISDFEKFKLQYTCPGPFKARNVYFDLNGIERV